MRNQYDTPSTLAEKWGTNSSKVLGFINSGELRAINLAKSTNGRPRWRITPDALADFERRRSTTANTAVTTPARRRSSTVRKYV